ncbi:hypothetical protein HDR64_01305 [bacterium]|nr:hypothetical protein [bacterium]
MIEPMLKYEILLFHQEFEPFLKALQAKGLLDLSLGDLAVKGTQEEDYRLGVRAERLERALDDWRRLHPDVRAAAADFPSDEAARIEWTEDALDRARKSAEQEALLRQAADKEAVWGVYDPALLEGLAQAGLTLRFGSMPAKMWTLDDAGLNYRPEKAKVAEAPEAYPVAVVAKAEGRVYFVYWDTLPADWRVQEEAAPTQPPAQWAAQVQAAQRQKAADEARVAYAADRAADFKQARKHCWNRLAYSVARADMPAEAEGSLRIVEGYLPAKDQAEFEAFLEAEGVFFRQQAAKTLSEEAQADVPVLLKNNAYARLFEPITKLFSLPGYRELDLTPLFAPFFMMFFGFCMGDAGYGLLFVLLGFLLRGKVKPDFRPILSLVCYLGAAAVVFGMLSGTFFGVSLVNVPALQRFHAYILGQDQLMMLSLALGGIQILFGMFVHVLNISRQRGFKYAVGALGWWLILVFAVPLLAERMTDWTLPVFVCYACYAMVGVGACGAFFYNSPGKPIWMNFGSGLWASYNTATGLVGDLLSYIRLFALGLTGGILGGVFNDLALQMSGSIPVLKQLIMILILLFGHGLNIALCALGSVVHPLRLTFVEFYKNAGFAGGGRAYQAFKIEE